MPGREIRTSFVLDGEANYKKAMSSISKEMRLLDAELNLATADFDDNADAMKILSASSETLNKKIDVQTQKIKATEKALKDAKSQYGENSDTAKSYAIDLAKAELGLKKMESELKDNDSQMEKLATSTDHAGDELNQLEKNIDEAGDKAEKTSGKMSSFGSMMSGGLAAGAKIAVGAIVAVAVAAGAAAMAVKSIVSNAAELGDTLMTTSNQLGVSTDTLQEWNYAAIYTDVTSDTMAKGLAKTVKAMGIAQDAGNDFIEVADGITVSMKNADGSFKSSEQMFYDSIDAIGGLSSETEKEIATQELFGKSYQEMMPLIKAGSGALDEYAGKAHDLGVVLDEDVVAKLDNFSDNMDAVKMQFSTAGALFTSNLIPALESGVSAISGVASDMNTALSDGFQPEDIATIGASISEVLVEAIKGLGDVLPEIATVLTTLLTEVIGIVSDLLPTLLPVLIQGAFTLLQSLMDAIIANVQPLSDMVTQLFIGIVNFIVSNLPSIINAALQIVTALASGLVAALPDLIPSVIEMVMSIQNTLLQNLPTLIQVALQLILTIVQGLAEALPQLTDYIPTLITSIVTTLVDNLPMIIEAAIQIITAVITGLIEALPKLLEMGPKIASKIGEALQGIDWGKFGSDMMQGLADGITSSIGKISDAASSVADTVTSYLHFSRPDVGSLRDYEAWMPDMMTGLAGGIHDNTGKVLEETAALATGMQQSLSLPTINNKVQNEILSTSETGSVTTKKTIEHTGTIRVEGVNSAGELIGVVEIIRDQLQWETMMA